MDPKRQVALAKTINGFKGSPLVSDAYSRIVPDLQIGQKGNVVNFSDFSNIMLNAGYSKLQNEFTAALLNKIGLTLIDRISGANPLWMFKKGSMQKGVDVELIFSNPAVAEDIGAVTDANMQKLLKTYKPDTKVAYLRTNRGADGLGDVYPVTIAQEDLRRAFQSLENLDAYAVSLIRSLTAGDEIDEFKYTKKIISNAVEENYVRTQILDADVESEATLKKFISKLKAAYINFTLPSTLNNAYTNFPDSMGNPATVISDRDDICLIIRSDVMANIDVAVLASAFNLDKATFQGRVVVVDKFDNDAIVAVICDQAWLQIYDTETTLEDFRNARTATTNFFLRRRGTFAIKPWGNAIVFLNDEDGLPEIAGTAIVPDSTAVKVGEVHNFRFTPMNATETVSLDAASTATVEIDNDNKTFKALTTGTIILQLVSNGAIESATITASA